MLAQPRCHAALPAGDLRPRAVTFAIWDFAGFDVAVSVAFLPRIRSTWFRDTDSNLRGIVQMLVTG
jgi:hypothetical protein